MKAPEMWPPAHEGRGQDYDKTYGAVARMESVRIVLAIIATLRLSLFQVDFTAAFLNSPISHDVYMRQPDGFIRPGDEDKVCRLRKSIYGTMQGSHDWQETLAATARPNYELLQVRRRHTPLPPNVKLCEAPTLLSEAPYSGARRALAPTSPSQLDSLQDISSILAGPTGSVSNGSRVTSCGPATTLSPTRHPEPDKNILQAWV
ncbi:retrovirus-related pol polyprotein [Lentinula edodes]|uniref:Retrovirus-related pol polyprotein n=1 Tax=Lentinula edodes TaxID=5353 RepID=A0A1Q3ERL6_LENED|nr:retrovirus-related pol polyprotein [Lentinula edodes]